MLNYNKDKHIPAAFELVTDIAMIGMAGYATGKEWKYKLTPGITLPGSIIYSEH